MSWRALHPGELDHEKIWLTVGLGACVLGGAWLAWDLPRPECNFRLLTGWPCPTCGTTRAVVALTRGDVLSALQWNPLVTTGFAVSAAYLLYAAVVVLGRLPRWRPPALDPPWPLTLRIGAAALLLGNWAYLFWARI